MLQNSKIHANTVFENHRKSLILHCERSELRLHFIWTKGHKKQCYHSPDWSLLKGKCQNSNATFWVIFKQCGLLLRNFPYFISGFWSQCFHFVIVVLSNRQFNGVPHSRRKLWQEHFFENGLELWVFMQIDGKVAGRIENQEPMADNRHIFHP